MMLLFVFICILLVLVSYKAYKQNKDIKEISKQLNRNHRDKTETYVKLRTNDLDMQNMLSEINHLLSDYKIKQSEHMTLEDTTKKMIANFSHDMKTPLTVILGYLEMSLLDEQVTITERERIQRAYEKTKELLKLMNGFFELAKLEAQDVDVQYEDVDICNYMKAIVLEHYPEINKKNIELITELPETPVIISSNKEMIRRILNNLIGNALAYGSDGHLLGIKLEEEAKYVSLVIWDKGKGVDRKYQEDVFNRLFTLEDSRNKNYQGSGLGLSISKQLVELLGGEIELESIPHERTAFTVRLPKVGGY